MKEVQTRTVLLVTLGVLLLSFFSYSVGFGTGHVTAAGDEYYDCVDYQRVLKYFLYGGYQPWFDINKDGEIMPDDVAWIQEEALKHPCPLPDACSHDTCNNRGNLVQCVENEFGVKEEVVVACEGGMICKQKYHAAQGGKSQSSFSRVPPVATAACVSKKGVPDYYA